MALVLVAVSQDHVLTWKMAKVVLLGQEGRIPLSTTAEVEGSLRRPMDEWPSWETPVQEEGGPEPQVVAAGA